MTCEGRVNAQGAIRSICVHLRLRGNTPGALMHRDTSSPYSHQNSFRGISGDVMGISEESRRPLDTQEFLAMWSAAKEEHFAQELAPMLPLLLGNSRTWTQHECRRPRTISSERCTSLPDPRVACMLPSII